MRMYLCQPNGWRGPSEGCHVTAWVDRRPLAGVAVRRAPRSRAADLKGAEWGVNKCDALAAAQSDLHIECITGPLSIFTLRKTYFLSFAHDQ